MTMPFFLLQDHFNSSQTAQTSRKLSDTNHRSQPTASNTIRQFQANSSIFSNPNTMGSCFSKEQEPDVMRCANPNCKLQLVENFTWEAANDFCIQCEKIIIHNGSSGLVKLDKQHITGC